MPRLGHKKSRLGCRHCKARHVECDELKPCSNCTRHGVPCSLVTWDPNVPQPPAPIASASGTSKRAQQTSEDTTQSGPSSTQSPSLLIDYVLNPPPSSSGEGASVSAVSEGSSPSSQPDQFPFLTKFIHRTKDSQSDIWVRDLELMHHWTIEAFDELSQRDDMRHTWRVDAPKHAVTHTFLMHEILAFSAFHKAHKLPDQRAEYYAFGIHHQDLTIRGVREKLHNVTADEAAAIVATSTLLTLGVFASTGFELNCPEISRSQSAIDGILNIFNLMQGMGSVLALAQTYVVNSFIAPMFRDPLEATPSQPMLQELIHQLPTLISFIEGKSDLPGPEREVYRGIIGQFEPGLRLSMPPRIDNRELRFLFYWPLHLGPAFFTFLRQRHSGALAIVMYYATIVFAAQSRYWFMQGWGEQLMRACFEELDQDWLPGVQWPVSFINHTPTYNLFSNLMNASGITSQGPGTNNPFHPPRAPVEVPYRHYVTPLLPYEQRVNPSIVYYSEHAMASGSPQDQKVDAASYTQASSRSTEDNG